LEKASTTKAVKEQVYPKFKEIQKSSKWE